MNDSMNVFEREEVKQLLLLENMAKEFSDADENVVNENVDCVLEPQVISDGEAGSFYDDSYNVDSTDDEVCAVKERRRIVKESTRDDRSK